MVDLPSGGWMRLNSDCNGRPGKSRLRLEVISWMNSDEEWLSAAAARGTKEMMVLNAVSFSVLYSTTSATF